MFNLIRGKIILVPIILIIAGMILGTTHDRAVKEGNNFLPVDIIRSMMIPFNISTHGLFAVGRQIVGITRSRSSLIRENAALRKQVRDLTSENASLREAANENVYLRKMLDIKESSPLKLSTAHVISRKESSWFDTATIDKGRKAGIQKGAAVLNHLGLIGQITEAGSLSSQMISITDSNSAIGAMVQRSRSKGIVQGQGADYLVLSYLPKDADVLKSDIIVSSGMGKVIPKGLVIGRVVKVVRDPIAGTTSALVSPSVKFDQIEQIFIANPGQENN